MGVSEFFGVIALTGIIVFMIVAIIIFIRELHKGDF